MHIHARGGGSMIFQLQLVILNGQNINGNIWFYTKGKGDECHEGLMLGMRGIPIKYMASKILDFFEEFEKMSNAHGMGVSSRDALISNCNVSITSYNFNFEH